MRLATVMSFGVSAADAALARHVKGDRGLVVDLESELSEFRSQGFHHPVEDPVVARHGIGIGILAHDEDVRLLAGVRRRRRQTRQQDQRECEEQCG